MTLGERGKEEGRKEGEKERERERGLYNVILLDIEFYNLHGCTGYRYLIYIAHSRA